MTTRAPSHGQLEESFARVNQLQAELQRKARAIGRKVQVLGKGPANLMEPGSHLHRIDVGLHAFDADGAVFNSRRPSRPIRAQNRPGNSD